MDENKFNNEQNISAEPIVPTEQTENPIQINPINTPPEPQVVQTQPTTGYVPPYTYKWDYTAQRAQDAAKKDGRKNSGLLAYAIVMSVAFIVAILLLLGVMFLGSPKQLKIEDTTSLADLYDMCLPSYVAISTINEYGGDGAGSGIIMTSNGYICTNYHVVENASNLKVILHNGNTYKAKYIDGDPLNDIAVIKIDVSGLTPAMIGSSKNSRVGDKVMAIGTPYGIDYRCTMTSGSISALNRQYTVHNESGSVNKVLQMIQTDTSVNPGNSGGPLFNTQGEVIGVVSMKIAGAEYEGMGFAIPIESVIDLINDIIKNGKITDSIGAAKEGAALGVTGFCVIENTTYVFSDDTIYYVIKNPTTGELCINIGTVYSPFYIPIDDEAQMIENGIVDPVIYTAPATGFRVESTTPGFHSDTVLEPFDIIMTANGIVLDTQDSLVSIIATCSPGDKLALEVYRDGKTLSISLTLGSSSDME